MKSQNLYPLTFFFILSGLVRASDKPSLPRVPESSSISFSVQDVTPRRLERTKAFKQLPGVPPKKRGTPDTNCGCFGRKKRVIPQ